MRAAELLKRTEDTATDETTAITRSYETLIEHEKSKMQWRNIKFYLNKGDTEPPNRLHDVISPHGTSDLCDQVLNSGQWATDTIEDLFAPRDSPADSDSDSEMDSKPEISDPEKPWEDLPD
mmetsp:Transcript_23100/g.46120  ORF Transcript_23100/g.46120 Transcript_23100/m.46120 type:complete len:121 (+) Transcript_23100:2268-2630(+)|eukprot:CAMPEP_0194346998 /NCGR_PEP_ID=MMETSP0171-20130528/105743_1 /TAXON_ID=218684 /ORGANISM="Corethron pennatum, Strain L29A3" /LENGTH=120 /DNA_ID=CAMNT_0039114199 /DNA_START=2383 /DNA_END=2745 /DNA_ORIENTATION=+